MTKNDSDTSANQSGSHPGGARTVFVLLLVASLAAVFLGMIADFLVALFLAATFAAMLRPVYTQLTSRLGDRPQLAAVLVLIAVVLVVLIPALALLALVANEALAVSEVVVPWIEEQISNPIDLSTRLPEWLPFAEELEPYKSRILDKLSEAAGTAGSFLVDSISNVTRGTVGFFLNLALMLYAMFFFLCDGPELLGKAAAYLPLNDGERDRVLDKGLAITRATLKSVLIIGFLQGLLIGLAFLVIGIEGAAFWGAIVMVLSSVPAAGAPIVWGPAALYLLLTGQVAAGVGLIVWGGAVVGVIDNVLRPRLLSEGTRMPDILILVSILGGISAFGAVGILLGPILAGYLIVTLDIYRTVFAESLPASSQD